VNDQSETAQQRTEEPMMSLPWRAFWILMTAFFVTKVIVGAHKAMAYFGVSPIWG
jgi:hypothetical protein